MKFLGVLFFVGFATTAQAGFEKNIANSKPKARGAVPLYAIGQEQWSGDLNAYLDGALSYFEQEQGKAQENLMFNELEYDRRKYNAISVLSDIAHMSIRSCPKVGIEIMGVYECRGRVAKALVSRMGDLRDHDQNINGSAYDVLRAGKLFKKSEIAEDGTGVLAGNSLFKSYGVESVSCSYDANGEAACVVAVNGRGRPSAPKFEVEESGKAKRAPGIVEDKREAKPGAQSVAQSEFLKEEPVARKMYRMGQDELEYELASPPAPMVPDAPSPK